MGYTVGWVDIEEGVDTGLSANAKIREGFTNTQTALNGLDNRAGILESWTSGFLKSILSGSSTAASQLPSTVNTPLQIEFGAAQNSGVDDAMLAVDGTITFNVAGTYRVNMVSYYGRTGTEALSILSYRWLVNDTMSGDAAVAKINDDGVIRSWNDELLIVATAGDTLKCELVRDSSGDNSGGLYQTTLNAAGWGTVPSASIEIKRLV